MDNKSGHQPAYPCFATGRYGDIFVEQKGMSKRLLLAGMAMQGILAHTGYEQNEVSAIQSAFRFADELLKQEAND